MITPIFNGKVEHGKLFIQSRNLFDEYVSSLNGEVQVMVRKRKKNRSENQNAWYWVAVVGIPAKHFGYSPQEMHDAFKLKFLRREEQGKPTTVASSAMLNTTEFTEYVEAIRAWLATDYEITIPDPEQIYLQ